MTFRTGFFDKKFKDIDMSFELNPVTKDLKMVYDVDAIKQSLKKLLTTKKLWNFDHLNLNELLFEDFSNPLEMTVVLTELEDKLKKLEPRVSFLRIGANAIKEHNMIAIDISFGVKTIPGSTFDMRVFRRVR